MTAANTRAGGFSYTPVDAMDVVSAPNIAPNSSAIPNVPHIYCCGGNELNLLSTRFSTVDCGINKGIASQTHSGRLESTQGSSKYFIQGAPATRQGDASTTNNHNGGSVQLGRSQPKCNIDS
ncbi:DUF4150 domain-containing protein [Enterobacteriaceae bacterium 4M9]|nr:DUF4150 domain-containing protein [Enterobacteriaceae bacterium 4M9]